MRKILLVLAILLSIATVALPACSILGDPIAGKVADAIDKYCQEPQNARALYRETINDRLAGEGHSIRVTCQRDPEPPVPSSWLRFEPGNPAYLFADIDPPSG